MKGDAEKVSFGTVPSGSIAVTLSLASSVLIALALTKATYLKPKIPSSLSKCGHLWPGNSVEKRTREPHQMLGR